MIDLKARVAAASLPEDTVLICLDGKALAELRQAQEAADKAAQGISQDLEPTPDRQAADEALLAAQDAVRHATDPWLLRGLPRPAWTSLMTKHLPREGNAEDEQLGWNAETLPPALVRACLVDPDVTDDALWAQVEQLLTPSQIDELGNVAFRLSRIKVDLAPFFSPASSGTAASGAKSRRPAS